ncbi:hypothetical protein D3C73_975540 [compost metagenome]
MSIAWRNAFVGGGHHLVHAMKCAATTGLDADDVDEATIAARLRRFEPVRLGENAFQRLLPRSARSRCQLHHHRGFPAVQRHHLHTQDARCLDGLGATHFRSSSANDGGSIHARRQGAVKKPSIPRAGRLAALPVMRRGNPRRAPATAHCPGSGHAISRSSFHAWAPWSDRSPVLARSHTFALCSLTCWRQQKTLTTPQHYS